MDSERIGEANPVGLETSGMLCAGASYDNPAFQQHLTRQSKRKQANLSQTESDYESLRYGFLATSDTDHFPTLVSCEDADLVDEDSFRSDLERDSVHSSVGGTSAGNPGTFQANCPFTQSLTHEQRYNLLVREGNRRASLQFRQTQLDRGGSIPEEIQLAVPADPTLAMESIELGVQRATAPPATLTPAHASRDLRRDSRRQSTRSRPRAEPRPQPRKHIEISYNPRDKPRLSSEKPVPGWANLFGIIDTSKIQYLLTGQERPSVRKKYEVRDDTLDLSQEPQSQRHSTAASLNLAASNPKTPEERYQNFIKESESRRGRQDALFYGSILTFLAGLLLLMSFASPYWLVSWDETQSPFKNMGLWEFCFYRYHHPDYQFDKLFHGCHALYGDEYRLIREKLLPGWLMVVQLFVTLGFIFSFSCQILLVALLLRYPLEVILRFEYHFCGVACLLNGVTAVLLFLSVLVFGVCCWDRDWLLYPNFNYVSWSFAFAVISCLIHLFAALLMAKDYKDAKERKEKNKALIMQMQPPGFSGGSHHHMGGGSGYI